MHSRFLQSMSRSMALVLAIAAMPALANTSKYSFKIQHRSVRGYKNGVTHSLTSGVLTISGKIKFSPNGRFPTSVGPAPINIEVRKNTTFGSDLICAITVTPSGSGDTPFSKTCPSVSAATFFVDADKHYSDGWTFDVAGGLTTI